MKYGKLHSNGSLQLYRSDNDWNSHYIDVGGEWQKAYSSNTLPVASYFGMLYNEQMKLKQICYIAGNKNSIVAEEIYNNFEYIKVIEYYIINITLQINS